MTSSLRESERTSTYVPTCFTARSVTSDAKNWQIYVCFVMILGWNLKPTELYTPRASRQR